MRAIALLLLVACAGLSVSQARAAVFIVDTLFDGALDHDTTPGDGVCDSDRGATCSLRAAIEEANALPGADIVGFSVAGKIVPSTEGALPTITDPLTINGVSAPGYNTAAADIGDAPPGVEIDGIFLSTASADGLRFGSGSGGSRVRGMGVINMPDNGIELVGGANASDIGIEANWIGLARDGSSGPNGGEGVLVDVLDVSIGKRTTVASGVVALGNLIASNEGHGILLQIDTERARIQDNWIGYAANGATLRGNGGYGIQAVGGDDHLIGGVAVDGSNGGNRIGGNALGGIQLFGTRTSTVQANQVGSSSALNDTDNPGPGIHVVGTDNLVGGNTPELGNDVNSHAEGIRLGFGVLQASGTMVQNNRIGSGVFDVGVVGNGIWVESGTGNTVRDNDVWHARLNGVFVSSNENLIRENRIGYRDHVFEGATDRGASSGIVVAANNNEIIANTVGFSENDGIVVIGTGNEVRLNHVGITPDGIAIGNGGVGIAFTSFSQQPIGNIARTNSISNNGDGGILVRGDATALGNRLEFNRVWMNGGPAIDLVNADGSGTGINPNDAGDGDEGVNRLMNSPVIHSAVWSLDAGVPQVTVQFSVDAGSDAAAYPMYVDVFLGSAGLTDTREYLPSGDQYTLPGAMVSRTYAIPGVQGGHVLAMSIDFFGNSSEMSLPVAFGNPDAIFGDGFEGPL